MFNRIGCLVRYRLFSNDYFVYSIDHDYVNNFGYNFASLRKIKRSSMMTFENWLCAVKMISHEI